MSLILSNLWKIILRCVEIVRVALLLTGCIQGIRNTVQDYLNSFATYNWIWRDDKESSYGAFMKTIPSLDDFDRKLRSFGNVDTKIGLINDLQNIGALSLRTVSIKAQLRSECRRWSVKFSDNLHGQSKNRLEQLTEFIRITTGKVVREVSDLDSLRFIMRLLVDVRERESSMEMEISPIMDMYRMLESYLPAGFMDKVSRGSRRCRRGSRSRREDTAMNESKTDVHITMSHRTYIHHVHTDMHTPIIMSSNVHTCENTHTKYFSLPYSSTYANTHTHTHTQDEIDKKTVLRANWKRLLKQSETRTEELSKTQTKFKRLLLKDIKDFKVS